MKQKIIAGDLLHETALGYINPYIKNLEFSQKTSEIFLGMHDNEPFNDNQPILEKLRLRILEEQAKGIL